MDRWELVDGGSAKFWEIGRDGTTVTVRFGRLGTAGQTSAKELASEADAIAHVTKLVAAKEKKGYKSASADQSTEDSAEQSAVEQPVRLPDETTFVMPKAWADWVVPRRGGRVVEPVEIMPKAGAYLLARIDALRPRIDTVLSCPESDATLVAAARDYLAGTATPLGAAAVVTTVSAEDREANWGNSWRLADALVELHGLVFAAEAGADLSRACVTWWSAGRQHGPHKLVAEMGALTVVKRMRRILAVVDQERYDAVVEALASHRNDDNARSVVSYMVPTREDWVDEVNAAWASFGHYGKDMLCESVNTPAQFEALARHRDMWWTMKDTLYTVIDGIGPAAAPGLGIYLDHVSTTDERKKALQIIAALPTDDAFDVLLTRVDQRHVRATLLDVMKRYPVRALRRLAASDSPAAANLLREHVQLNTKLVDQVLADLPAETRAVIEGVTARVEQVTEATDLPELLVNPPWLRKRAKTKPTVVEGLEPPVVEPGVVWLAGERDEWARPVDASHWYGNPFPGWDKALADFRRNGLPDHQQVTLFLSGPEEEMRPALATWKSDAWRPTDWGKPLVARYELDSLPPIHWLAVRNPGTYGDFLVPFAVAELAPLMAEWLVRLKSARATAESWLARHAPLAATVLIPQALAKPSPQRTYAEAALRVVARHVDPLPVARTHGDEAEQAVAALLDVDPLDVLPARTPVLPAFANPELLPRLRLRDSDTVLPHAAVGHFLTMLAMSKIDDVYPGVGVVTDLCDPGSLAEFGWALFERWLAVDGPAKESWALSSLGLLGDDTTVRRLTPMIRAWPGENGHAKAVVGLDVLAEIGTDVALMSLQNIAQKVPFKALKQRAQEKIESVAEGLGLSGDQLGDRLVPTFGLDEDATGTIDYGPRKFVVGFDEQLKPYVTDEDGKRRKDLPKPGAKDDQELAPAEHKRFAQLKKDVRTVAGDQISRLEAAMVAGREWPVPEFTTLLVGHPLVWHIVRRLVWVTDSGTTFRVAEDRTFADANDDTYVLQPDAVVSVAHPLNFDVETWAEVFADYEILQPFAQLGRTVYSLSADEQEATHLKRFEGVTLPVGKLLGLTKRGWRRGEPQDNGAEHWLLRPVPGGGSVVLNPDPGLTVGYVDMFPEQTLEHIWLSDHRHGGYHPEGHRTFGELDPVTASEVLSELTDLTS